MNPVIVIPSYWDIKSQAKSDEILGCYDHATPVDKAVPELETCLQSLEQVRGVMRVVILLVAPVEVEEGARGIVDNICKAHSILNPCVIGTPEANLVKDKINELVPDMSGETVSLRGYGAIRNMGLAVAAVLGHDVVVFLDDDEIALTPDYLINAVYGLGRVNRQGLPILAKSGYFLNPMGSPYADTASIKWYDKKWAKKEDFNAWLSGALSGIRMSRSNVMCGGCMAVHADAFMNVAFDPWITRGEDFDYLINLRMRSIDVWFDNKWRVKHMPPPTSYVPSRFQQDIYRWLYEAEKIDTANSYIRLRPITQESLSPYPGKWINKKWVLESVNWTVRARIVGTKQHLAYLKIKHKGIISALNYAKDNAYRYFSFMTFWPTLMAGLWDDDNLAQNILSTASFERINNNDETEDAIKVEDE